MACPLFNSKSVAANGRGAADRPISDDELQKIAAIQQTSSAFEDVIADLDTECLDRAA